MKNRIIALVVGMILLLFSSLAAQAPDTLWTRTYGGTSWDYSFSVQQTSDDGYIVTGGTESYGNGHYDVWLIKIDSLGNKVWDRTFGRAGYDIGYAVHETSDSGYIITGGTESYGAGSNDVWLIRTDKRGHKVWDKTFGGPEWDEGYSVKQTSDGGYIITGFTFSFGAGHYDVWLIKTDGSGNKSWEKTFGGAGYDHGYSVQQTNDGGYIITGVTGTYGAGGGDVWLIKADSAGNRIWDKTFGGTNNDKGFCVQQTVDNGFIIVGWTWSFGEGLNDVWLIKTDNLGNKVWDRTFGGTNFDEGYSVQQISDGGYIITGLTWSYSPEFSDVILIRTDSLGYKVWDKTLGGDDYDEGYSVQKTRDGGYVIAGWTWSYSVGFGDVWLIKTEPDPANINDEPTQKIPSRDLKLTASPNPFSVHTNIQLQGGSGANLTIYDALGRRVREISLLPFSFSLGAKATWDGHDEMGKEVQDGVYFIKAGKKCVEKVVKVR